MPAPRDPPSNADGPDISVGPLRYHPKDLIAEKYELVELMGTGGMGSVWRAKNLALGAEVAIKLVHGELSSPEMTDRLKREAQAAARLEHPSAVRVFDFGESELGDPFIVMELLRGESLRDLLERRGALPAKELVALMLPVASALVAAHQKGIVHRDLKPENIVLVEHEGHSIPKVVDFGLAKVEATGFDRRSTREGTILGSPDYMAPEQARGDVSQMDARTDVWGLGVVVYESLAGKTPFGADHPLALLRAIIEDDPAKLEGLGAADARLSEIVARALAKAPADRWPDMRAFGRALAEWALAEGVDTDATGASIAAHWTRGSRASLSSDQAQVLVTTGRVSVPAPPPVASVHAEPSAMSPEPAAESGPAVWRARGRPSSRRWIPWSFAAAVVVGLGALALSGLGRGPQAGAPTTPATPPASANLAAPVPRPQTSGSSASSLFSSTPSATAEAAAPSATVVQPRASAAASAASSNPDDARACIAKLFPEDAFEPDAQVAKLCAESDPRKGAALLRSEIARHGFVAKRTTEAMQIWSLLSWYELATFAVARGSCCAIDKVPALDLPPSVGTCPPLAPILDEIEHSAHGKVTDPMVKDFRTTALCIDRGQRINDGVGSPFSYDGPPGGGAESAFRRILERAK